MTTELDIYKKNKINAFKKVFNINLERLKSILYKNIKNVQKSKLNVNQKQKLINDLINKYNISVNSLKSDLKKNITNIKNFNPNSIIIENNKYEF